MPRRGATEEGEKLPRRSPGAATEQAYPRQHTEPAIAGALEVVHLAAQFLQFVAHVLQQTGDVLNSRSEPGELRL